MNDCLSRNLLQVSLAATDRTTAAMQEHLKAMRTAPMPRLHFRMHRGRAYPRVWPPASRGSISALGEAIWSTAAKGSSKDKGCHYRRRRHLHPLTTPTTSGLLQALRPPRHRCCGANNRSHRLPVSMVFNLVTSRPLRLVRDRQPRVGYRARISMTLHQLHHRACFRTDRILFLRHWAIGMVRSLLLPPTLHLTWSLHPP